MSDSHVRVYAKGTSSPWVEQRGTVNADAAAAVSLSCAATLKFAGPEHAFRWLRLPGMELAPPQLPAPPPMVGNFCGCGREISLNKACCRRCQQAELARVAAMMTSRATLQRFLGQFTSDEQVEVMAALVQYLPADLPAEENATDEHGGSGSDAEAGQCGPAEEGGRVSDCDGDHARTGQAESQDGGPGDEQGGTSESA